MKTALLVLNNFEYSFPLKKIEKVKSDFFNNGIIVNDVEIIDASRELFINKYQLLTESSMNVIIFGLDSASSLLRQIICNNEDNVINFPSDDNKDRGFILEKNGKIISVLTNIFDDFSSGIDFLISYYKSKYKLNVIVSSFRLLCEKDKIVSAIEKSRLKDSGFDYIFSEDNLDAQIKICAPKGKESLLNEINREIDDEIGDYVYAKGDIGLGETLFTLLKLKNIKVGIAESFTGGRVVGELVKNSGASDYVYEGIVSYTDFSKRDRLKVSEIDLIKEGAVSSKVAYEMATGILNGGNVQMAISTTGLAGPNGDGSDNPVGLCYFGIGNSDGVHVYKQQFCGDREQITEKGKNTALFLAINILKKL